MKSQAGTVFPAPPRTTVCSGQPFLFSRGNESPGIQKAPKSQPSKGNGSAVSLTDSARRWQQKLTLGRHWWAGRAESSTLEMPFLKQVRRENSSQHRPCMNRYPRVGPAWLSLLGSWVCLTLNALEILSLAHVHIGPAIIKLEIKIVLELIRP